MKIRMNSALTTFSLVAAALMLFACARPGTVREKQEEAVKSLVSTSTADNGWAVNYPKQRKLFYAAGRFWVFYADRKNGYYRTSADGKKWSEPVLFGADGHFGHRFGLWFDGAYFHYALCNAVLGGDVFYRRGKPKSDGAIEWSAPEQKVYDTPADKNVMYPKLVVDSNGCPWITFMELVYQVPNTPPYDALVIKAATHDGTWTTAPGFPFTLAHKPVAGYPDPVGAPLTGGKVLWFYNSHADGANVFAARAWNGAAWEKEEIVANPGKAYGFFNIVADGDDVHVIHSSGVLKYQKRTWGAGDAGGGGWSQPFTVAAGGISGHSSITRTGHDSVIVTWLDHARDAVCCREMTKGSWAEPVTLVEEPTEHLADPSNHINMNTLVNSSKRWKHAVIYTTGLQSPFKVKFAAVTVLPTAKPVQ